MVVLTFIYFLSLTLFLYFKNKREVDIACYISSIYCISGFFAILIDAFDIRQAEVVNYDVSLVSSIIYCVLITLCILPFILFSNGKISLIEPISKAYYLKMIAVLSFAYFVFYTGMSLNTLIKVFTGDIGEIRKMHYMGVGEESWMATWSPITRAPFTMINYILGCPWILQFLAFFSIAIQKLPIKYSVMFLIASFIGFVQNFVAAGRSDMIYWLINIGACYIFFKKYFSKKEIKTFRKYIVSGVIFFLICIIMVSMSRFGEDNDNMEIGGTEAGLISYAGQSFVNFCYFFDNFDCPNPTLEIIFPLTYQILGISQGGVVIIQEALTQTTPFRLGVFYTYLGQIFSTSNILVLFIYCVVFYLGAVVSIRKVQNRIVSIKISFLYYAFSSVLFLGLFSHYYGYSNKTFSVIFFTILLSIISHKKIIVNK